MSMLRQIFLCHLHVHLGTMLLETKLRVLLKPPRLDLALADTTEHRGRRSLLLKILYT
jgi:hypothetical protein